MLPGNSLTNNNYLKAIIAGLIVIAFGSCTAVREYPKKPFVFRTNINLIGDFSNEKKKDIISGLEGQLDDSMQARKLDKLAWKVLKKPPVYDSTNADKSIMFMRALLNSYGYFTDTIWYTSWIKQPNWIQKIFPAKYHPYRTIVTFHVEPRKLVTLDSVSYNLRHPELQHIADSTMPQAYIKKGDPFAKNIISAELDRLTELYRNSGYLKFSRDELVGVWDTLDVSLLRPTLDPFEQLQILQKLRQRRENPTANLEIRLRSPDSARLVKYYIGNVVVYPEVGFDTTGRIPKTTVVEGVSVTQYYNTFKPKIFPPNIFLPHGSLYTQRRYLRTLNRFNGLTAWRLASVEPVPRKDQDTVDFIIRLSPAKKYSFSTNLEGSINQSAISGNLFGIGVNVGLQNRNFAKAANLASTNVRYGIELGNTGSLQFIQSKQVSFTHNIYFPRFIPNTKLVPERLRDNLRSVFSFNATNTERRLLYNLTTLNGSFGWEFQRRNVAINFKPVNIEYSYLIKRDSLDTLIKYNPSLRNIFTDGLIISWIVNGTYTWGKSQTTERGRKRTSLNVLRGNLEFYPIFLEPFLKSDFFDKELYKFVKFDLEYARLIRFTKTALALRGFLGAGYELAQTRNPDKRNNLPFFKQYFSGGPNSMRAWALRRLGPGSVIKEFSGLGSTPDRYGDIQLEANAEYRFPVGSPFGIKVNGAIFTDIGNVWLMKKQAGAPEEVFKLSRLGKDIAVGAGAGLRVDLNFFVIRFDYSYKVKDPSPAPADAALQNKWFGYKFFNGDQFQLGIGYPFIF
jgi:outer membrane protein insertion porin family